MGSFHLIWSKVLDVSGRLFAPFTSLLCLLNEGAMSIFYGFVIKPRTDVCCVTACPFLRGIVRVY